MDGSDAINVNVDPTTSPSPAHPDGVDVLTDDGGIANGPEVRLKHRGRDRLLRGLQRMSSSPSLNRTGRARSASSPYSMSGTLSCVSLASTSSPFGQPSSGSYFSQSSAGGYSSAHTSIPTSPIAESPVREGFESALAARPAGCATTSTTASLPARVKKKSRTFNLWAGMPHELKVHVLAFLRPKELVRASRVSKEFHTMCFDGQLWTSLDASEFYSDIPAESLAKIIVSAGPFVKDLNLRGCLQVEHYQRAEVVVKACRNLINATLEGCRNFKRSTLHSLLKANDKLAHLNLTGLAAVNNTTCKIVAESCPQLEVFNVSWCKHMDARGLKYIIDACPKLTDLRAGEIKGFSNLDVATSLFHTNTLHRLVLAGCDDLTDAGLQTLLHGPDPEIDILTNLPLVPARKLRHLDLSRCTRLTSAGIKTLAHLVPHLEGLQLSGVTRLTDAGLEPVLATVPRLSHLELEDCAELSNPLLAHHLAKAPCAATLQHLSVSYCANLSDAGVLPVVRACTALRTVYLDNTGVSDLVLAEAAGVVRERAARRGAARRGSLGQGGPVVSLNLVVYDCPNVTWTGVREVLSRNADVPVGRGEGKGKGKGKERVVEVEVQAEEAEEAEEGEEGGGGGGRPRNITTTTTSATAPPAPAEIIGLKCFYGWQMTVDEHTKRVLRGDFAAARRLERKWADYMQANEEAGTVGAGIRRRRRRAREAQMVHDEEEGGGDGAGEGGGATVGGRRRARTTVCAVM